MKPGSSYRQAKASELDKARVDEGLSIHAKRGQRIQRRTQTPSRLQEKGVHSELPGKKGVSATGEAVRDKDPQYAKQQAEKVLGQIPSRADYPEYKTQKNEEKSMKPGSCYKEMKKEEMEKGLLDEAKKIGGKLMGAAKWVGHQVAADAKTVAQVATNPSKAKPILRGRLHRFVNETETAAGKVGMDVKGAANEMRQKIGSAQLISKEPVKKSLTPGQSYQDLKKAELGMQEMAFDKPDGKPVDVKEEIKKPEADIKAEDAAMENEKAIQGEMKIQRPTQVVKSAMKPGKSFRDLQKEEKEELDKVRPTTDVSGQSHQGKIIAEGNKYKAHPEVRRQFMEAAKEHAKLAVQSAQKEKTKENLPVPSQADYPALKTPKPLAASEGSKSFRQMQKAEQPVEQKPAAPVKKNDDGANDGPHMESYADFRQREGR